MQPHTLPQAIDLRILGACNLHCPFCFGPRHELNQVSLKALLQLLAELPPYGVKRIVITGGEPTLVRELPMILAAAKSLQLKTVLSTNGLLMKNRLDEIAPHLDWIGIPLDGDSPDSNCRMRLGHPRHFETVLELIAMIKTRYPHLRIKLGTVVCALNKDHVVGITKVIQEDYKPDVWKLYPVAYSSYAEDNKEQLLLSDEDLDSIIAQALAEAKNRGITATTFTREERNGAHLFLEPTGDAMVVSDAVEKHIGNFFDDFNHVLNSWQRFIDVARLEQNFLNTYPD